MPRHKTQSSGKLEAGIFSLSSETPKLLEYCFDFETYDTYSLGVLLYKLMYTEYPIFPNKEVHIPTTPTYNQRLKKTLQLFLNKGGKLNEI